MVICTYRYGIVNNNSHEAGKQMTCMVITPVCIEIYMEPPRFHGDLQSEECIPEIIKSQQEGVKHMDSIILCTDNRRDSNEYEPRYTFKQRNPFSYNN